MITLINNHRSIRRYSDKPVDDATLNTILEAGAMASNTGNMQLYSVIVTRNAETKKALAPAHFNQPMIENAPVVLTLCADVNRFTLWCQQRNADAGFYNLESLITAFVDTSLVAQNISLAAESLGLGICYLGTTTYNPDMIADVLNLPKGVVPVTTITLGYPAEAPDKTPRLPLSAFVHNETYHDYSASDINAAYSDMEHDPKNDKFIKENNKENLAQVFAEVRYSKANNEHFSQCLMDFFKKQGMM